ncbi:GNAT family N-acetyltransferase [Desertihabitans aurantiacus]|uniref:GNAT family N-acetyltransferase n=1 Tax=Desertihabitans aurantiacus TaxID=2282477 RepID=UPI000DF779AC|nr:GNAT family N-acetyltransferase [Desertihabitans aurantiacus]
MTITDASWYHPDPGRVRLHLDVVPADVLHALAAGEIGPLDPAYASPYLTGPECRGLWRMRSKQIRETPTDAPWITRLIVDPLREAPVGLAGFHGAPDRAGMVEVGYRVDPALRRRGHARGALETLLSVAQRHPDVRTVRATISPDNTASRALIDDYGFAETGEQWDEVDGRETIYEVSTSAIRLS